MSDRPPRNRTLRKLFVLAILITTGTASILIATRVGAAGTFRLFPAAPQSQTDFIRVVGITGVNDVTYSSTTGKLYVSVSSNGGSVGNTITTVDPLTGSLSNSVFVGSEPNKLALSDNGTTLYTTLEGAFAVRQFNVQTQTPGTQFSVGQDSFFGLYSISDLVVSPGNPNVVALARQFRGVSPPEAGVAVFDNGVQRPTTGPGHIVGSDFLAYSALPSKLYGSGNSGGLRFMTVDANGVTQTGATATFVGAQIVFHNNVLFTSSGQVYNPDTQTQLGQFFNVSTPAFVPDSSVNRAYYLVQENGNWTIKAFDINTFLQVGSLGVPGIVGNPTRMVRWGANGLAFRTSSGQLFIVQTSLIPSAEPIPTPTPTPSPSPTPTPFATFVQTVPLATNDLIYSAPLQKLFASVPSRIGIGGNSLTSIDPATATLGAPVFVGSEPNRLALSDDSQTLYVCLDGAFGVRRFDMTSQTPGLQFPIGVDSFNGVLVGRDIAVLPGSPETVAVARTNLVSSPSSDGVAIYDNGVKRTKSTTNTAFFVEPSATGSRVYSSGFSGSVDRILVDATGATLQGSAATATSGEIHFDNGLIYTFGGSVVDPETGVQKGTFNLQGSTSLTMTTDRALGRAFFLTQSSGSTIQLRAFDLNTFLPIGVVNISGTPGSATSLVRWGTNGLAFRTPDDRVFILQSALVNDSISVPPPTPTPTPSPTPTPTPQASTFFNQLPLPANDITYHSASQTIYASVPSSIGAPRGNSITPINPANGTLGSSVFVGSEPGRLAQSSDGQTLYTYLSGALAMRRFDIPSQTAGLQFALSGSAPTDLEVVPGSPQSIAISQNQVVSVYDDGVKRPSVTDFNSRSGPIEFASPTTLYGYNNGDSGNDFHKLSLDASGIHLVQSKKNLLNGGDISFANGLVYSTFGRVLDPETQNLVGSFKTTNTNFALGSTLVVDPALNRIFFAGNNGGGIQILAYELNTFLPVGGIVIQNVGSSPPTRMLRWGSNGLAIRSSDGQVVLIQSKLIANTPVPTGVRFSATQLSTSESVGNFNLTISRNGDLSSSTSVDFATSDGTATAGTDYTATSGTITFAPGQATRTVVIPILNDNVFENASETFTVNLSNPTNGALITGPPVTVTISDSQFRPSMNMVSILRATEGNSGTKNFVFPVTLSNASVQTITVNFATANGTAQAGSDYQATSGTLTFNPLQTSANITVVVNGDTTVEPDETFTVTLSNATNVNFVSNSVATATIATDDTAVQFSTATQSVVENTGGLSVQVNRVGDNSGTTTVEYATSDFAGTNPCSSANGTASSRCDYLGTSGKLTFTAGQTSKTINIPVIDDAYAEGSETFNLTLSNPSGGALGAPFITTLTISDNDSSTGPNPLDGAVFFVRQHYLDFLNREPDPSGFAFWTNQINSCGADAQCLEIKRINVSGAFFLSIEFQETGYLVYRMRKTSFGNLPGMPVPVRLTEFLKDTQRIGQGVQVGVGNWQSQLEDNKQAYALDLVQSPEFVAAYPDSMSGDQFITKLDTNAGGVLSPAEKVNLLGILVGVPGVPGRALVVRQVAEDSDLKNAEFNKAFVLMQYFGYMRRNPNDAPDTNFDGFNFWLDKLNQFNGNFVDAEMVKAFIISGEYRQRFGP